jgi:hypothetical protein
LIGTTDRRLLTEQAERSAGIGSCRQSSHSTSVIGADPRLGHR